MSFDYEPERGKKLLTSALLAGLQTIANRSLSCSRLSNGPLRSAQGSQGGRRRQPLHELNRNDFSPGHFVLQSSCQLVDVGGGDVYCHAFEHGNATAANYIASDLDH